MHEAAPTIDYIREQVSSICPRYGVKRLDLAGSAAAGRFVPGQSDLDFMVTFKPGSTKGHADRYFGLLFALEDSFGLPIDLISEAYLKNPYLIRSLEKNKINVFAA